MNKDVQKTTRKIIKMRHNETEANKEAYSKEKVLYRNAFIKQDTGPFNRTEKLQQILQDGQSTEQDKQPKLT